MKSTIKDIARKVGVNPSTVSRVINGTASISSETKEKIYEAMQEMDYHPNSQARGLVNGSTFTIGLVIDAGNSDAYSNGFFISSVSAIERAAQDRGYNVLIINSGSCRERNVVENLVLENRVDGVILPVSDVTAQLIDLLTQRAFPFVIMGEPDGMWSRECWVDMNNEQGSRLAVQHLIQAGYRCPVLFVENKANVYEKKRMEGFQKQLAISGIECTERNIIECGTQAEQIMKEMKKALSDLEKLDSVICTNNIVAFHVMKELKKGGKSIPEDIGIIAFNNYPLAEYMEPPLTVVDIDTYKLGEMAANILFDKMKHNKNDGKNFLIDTRIIVRKSTGERKEEKA